MYFARTSSRRPLETAGRWSGQSLSNGAHPQRMQLRLIGARDSVLKTAPTSFAGSMERSWACLRRDQERRGIPGSKASKASRMRGDVEGRLLLDNY